MVQVETSVEWEMKEARERKTEEGRHLERERERRKGLHESPPPPPPFEPRIGTMETG